jgi:hypothetical protein
LTWLPMLWVLLFLIWLISRPETLELLFKIIWASLLRTSALGRRFHLPFSEFFCLFLEFLTTKGAAFEKGSLTLVLFFILTWLNLIILFLKCTFLIHLFYFFDFPLLLNFFNKKFKVLPQSCSHAFQVSNL